MTKFLTVKDVAEMLQAKPSTIYNWSKQNAIPSFKIKGLLRFDSVEIEEWVKGSRTKERPTLHPETRTVSDSNIDNIIKSAIASSKDSSYTSSVKGKPDQVKPGRRD